MPDGSSNTILLVEACGRNITWTEPRDVQFDDVAIGVNLPGERRGESAGVVSGYHWGGAHVMMADGSVTFISADIDPGLLKGLLQVDDGRPGSGEFW
jgi:prepilin-type processing-associated H-X9-DG protein